MSPSRVCHCRQARVSCLHTTMALRRFAQENNAMASPRSPATDVSDSPRAALPPRTPRNRQSYGLYRSPADTPSISSSVPFDWEAARTRTQPPYATPVKGRKSVGTGMVGTPRKAVIRKKGLIERRGRQSAASYRIYGSNLLLYRIKAVPSNIAFEIALFPHNVPLPTPKSSARIIGGVIHAIHALILATRDSEEAWERLSDNRRSSWFDWVRTCSFHRT